MSTMSSNSPGATAVAYATPMLHEETSTDRSCTVSSDDCDEEPSHARRRRRITLSWFPPSQPLRTENVTKPKRMIGDINDPALNYLDSVCTAARVETTGYKRASVAARLVSAVVDLVVVSVLCAPFAAVLELANTNWQAPRTGSLRE